MEGRDIGTAVFPDAEVIIFLDAAPEVRGDRRYRQISPSFQTLNRDADEPALTTLDSQASEQQRIKQEGIIRDMKERDERDRNRAESPLKPAADAVILDSTALTLDEVLARAEQIVRSHLRLDPASV